MYSVETQTNKIVLHLIAPGKISERLFAVISMHTQAQ